MINFASLFTNFRMGGGNSSINELIDAPGTTIDRLLDEESFVNELKSNNSKITEFMKYDKYETLVEYVTKVGPEDNRKRSYKYPMSACDVLSSDSQAPIEFFFPEQDLYITEEIEEEKVEPQPEPSAEQKEGKITSVDSIEQPEPEIVAEEAKEEQTEEGASSTEKKSEVGTDSPSKAEDEKSQQESAQKDVKKVEKKVLPLSFMLYSYYEGEVNYTLAGYVSKIFSSFLTKKPIVVLKFLLEPTRFSSLLNHIESRSVCDLVVKILTHESTQALDERRNAFESMFDKVSKASEVYIISNLSAAICETIEKVSTALKGNGNQYANELSGLYFKPEIITNVITNVMSDDENISVYNSPILLTYLTNVPLVLPENDKIVGDLTLLLSSFLKKALDKLKVTRDSRKTLGFGRVKIVEIMSFVLKQNILECQNLAANESEFFPILFNLCQNYERNNVLHNEVVKIIEIALSQNETSPFLLSLIQDEVLMKFLTDETNDDMKIRAGEGEKKVRKGYIGHVVLICRKVQEYGAKNSEVQKFVDKSEFDYLLENLVNKEVFEYSKNLAGYGMNKKGKNNILFMKEEVLQEHLKFLTETPPPVYEPEPEHMNIQHPDLVEAEHNQMDGPSLGDLISGELMVERDSSSEDSESVNPKYWNKHIEYDIDDLMNDL